MENTGFVIFNKNINNNSIYHLKLKVSSSIFAKPGQFINIKISDELIPFLRRPFSIFNFKKGSIELVYKVVGEGTKKLSEKKKNDKINFLGPLGNSYIDFFNEKILAKKKIYLIAGGTGFASIHFLADWLTAKKIKFKLFYGARDKNELLSNFCKKYDFFISTDDGSAGKKGLITDFLNKKIDKSSILFACGPKAMLNSIKNIKTEKKFVSLEAYMGCGFGVCLSCVVSVKNNNNFEYKRVCVDGPIFEFKNIIL